MNKLFRLFALLLLGAALLPACSKSNDNEPLVVACEVSTSPYCYYSGHDTNPVAGVDIDLIEEIGKELGRPIKYKIVPFQQIFTLVSMGKADIGAAGVTITPERAERVLFSTVYDVSSQVIVVPKNSAITDESSLKNARVAAQQGTSDLTLLREHIKPRAVVPLLTQEEVNAALIDRRADAAVMDLMQAELLVKATGDTFKILEKPLSKDQYGLLFNKKDTELAETANKVIDKLKLSGVIAKKRAEHLETIGVLGTGVKEREEVKPFVLCLEASFAPFVYVDDDNHIVGVDVEMAEAIAAELKRPLQIRVVPFRDVLPLVMSGAADMGASGISITPERSRLVLFSESYEDGLRRILVREDATFDDIEDFKDLVIGAKKGTTNEEFALNTLHAKVRHYDNATPAIIALLNKEIDAFIDDEGEADLAAGKYVDRVKMLNLAIPAEQYGFAFQNGNTAAKAAADRVIAAKRASGELQALFRKYNTRYKANEANGI